MAKHQWFLGEAFEAEISAAPPGLGEQQTSRFVHGSFLYGGSFQEWERNSGWWIIVLENLPR